MNKIALLLVIIGAINWGLIGLLDFDLVETLFGNMTTLSRVVYSVIGVAGLWCITFLFNDREKDL